MPSHILWQNVAKNVTLIDIPRSISEAQGFNSPADHELLSTEPQAAPYPSTEPKTLKARARLAGNTIDQALHREYRKELTQALQDITQHHPGEWCLPRAHVENAGSTGKKRKFDEGHGSASISHPDNGDQASGVESMSSLPAGHLTALARAEPQSDELFYPVEGCALSLHTSSDNYRDGYFVANDADSEAAVSTQEGESSSALSFKYRMPPRSSFCLGDCTASYDFRKAVREHARQQHTSPTFDFILMDPPWPNRSIKRTHKTAGATYQTVPTLGALADMIYDMQLQSIMAQDALVGVWTTNKQAVRGLVLGSNGFFECWGVELIEEWLWLKTTVSGEPTSALDATWKKPYEVLLLGRKRSMDATKDRPKPTIARKVIVGVPDLHSRKPCLKTLIEPMLPAPSTYAALEIFARHLVAGWCSWGDECIKFNWDGYWRKRNTEN